MAVPQYVWHDVSSDGPAEWMIYYTRHMYMDVLQYVCADASSEYSAQWMI